MCLAIPGKILEIELLNGVKMANVDFGGVIKEVCVEWVSEVKKGDYVLAHVGTALTIIDEKSALESIEAFQQIANRLNINELENY